MPDQARAASGRTFFGEPRGVAYLAFTEAWERFSYYGMTALLVLYMTQQLFLPGHVGKVAGFAAFRAGLEAIVGPMTPVALASQIYGLYTGLVYFTPVFGGLVADRWIGKRNAVVLGAVLMSAGHIVMAFEQSFLLALVLLIVGCGLLKGNISAQVGALYPPDDSDGRTRGFTIFSIGINVGSVAGPLLCGIVAQVWGWHAGFALAGALMLIGLVTYLAGYRTLTETTAEAAAPVEAATTAGQPQWRVIAALVLAMALTIFQSVAYYQNTNIGLVWINDRADLYLLGFTIPVAWFASIDSLASILAVPPLFALWAWQQRHGGEPSEVRKIATGAWITAVANALLIVPSLAGQRFSGFFPLVYDVLLGIGFLYYWPPLLALVSQAAPPKLKSTMMGCAFLSLFVGNIIVGALGGLYEPMGAAAFWAMNAAIAATGGGVALLLCRPLERVLGVRASGRTDIPTS